jgi:ribosomal protein S13
MMELTVRQQRRLSYRTDGDLREFQQNLKSHITTTRFNNETWEENRNYVKHHHGVGCAYGTCEQISTKIHNEGVLMVLEMNNDENRIMGIGMVRNHPLARKHRIYSNEEYNRYAYVGRHRIDRLEMNSEEETIMRAFDILCFKGSRHLKRLRGIKTFPIDMLYRCKKVMDLPEFIKNMFIKRMQQ